MKKILMLQFILAFIFQSCVKEQELASELTIENSYEIHDNPNDTIQHHIYTIYKNYGVSVYFNDTIAKRFIDINYRGDSVFQYERVDFGYTYTGYDNLEYKYVYMVDSLEKMKAIGIIETYLAKVSPKLYPLMILVVNSLKTVASNNIEKDYNKGNFRIGYRSILLTGQWPSDKIINDLPDKILQQTVINKISQFETQLTMFKKLSNKEWYDCFWENISPEMKGLDAGALYDGWWKESWYTKDELEAIRTDVRHKIGKYGFVSKHKLMGGIGSPSDENDDLSGYVNEIFNRPGEEFKKLWGHAPLVMQKYEILVNVIQNELGIEL